MPEPISGSQEVLTREEAAAVQQAQALQNLVSALSPLVQQIIDGAHAAKREANEHELRIAQLEAQSTERLHRRAFPLVWFGVIVVTLLLGWSALANRWEIVTHALTAIIAGVVGYALRRPVGNYTSDTE